MTFVYDYPSEYPDANRHTITNSCRLKDDITRPQAVTTTNFWKTRKSALAFVFVSVFAIVHVLVYCAICVETRTGISHYLPFICQVPLGPEIVPRTAQNPGDSIRYLHGHPKPI